MKGNNIRKRDKISAMVSVTLIFAICSSICIWVYLTSIRIDLVSYKDVITKKSERQNSLRTDQGAYKSLCDSLYMRIDRFDPGVNASFEESDIKFLINDLKGMYEQHSFDKRYKVFHHVAIFYDMWFADKKVLWSKKSNIHKFRDNLEQCEMGLTKKEEELTAKQKRN